MEIYDCLIIGGGPAGLYATFYAGLRDMRVKLVEHQSTLGGKLNLYPEKIIWDVGGHSPISAQQFKEALVEQSMTFNPDIALNTSVKSIQQFPNYYAITTENHRYYSKAIVLATGRGIFTPEKLNIQYNPKFELTNLYYTIKSLSTFNRKDVVISGSGNVALDYAEMILPVAKSITMICRKNKASGHEAMINKLNNHPNFNLIYENSITQLLSNNQNDYISHIKLSNDQTINCDALIVSHGVASNMDLLGTLKNKFAFNDVQQIETINQVETTLKGFYVAGDQSIYNNKPSLIMSSMNEGCQAINKAKTYIDLNAPASGIVSSHNDKFKQLNIKNYHNSNTNSFN